MEGKKIPSEDGFSKLPNAVKTWRSIVNLSDEVRAITEILQASIPKKVRLEFDLSADVPPVFPCSNPTTLSLRGYSVEQKE
jgi:hypothetical protein